VKVDHKIEVRRAKLARHHQITAKPAPSVWTRQDDEFVEMGVAPENRSGLRFDEIADPGIWKVSADCTNCGSRKDDIANQPRPDQQDFHGCQLSTVRSMPRRST
jgi:hypothetical protein